MSPGSFTGDPFGFTAFRGDLAIECHGAFGDDEWAAMDDPVVEGFVELGGFAFEEAVGDFEAGGTEDLESRALMSRIWIGGSDEDAFDAGGDDCVCARRSSSVAGTRLEGDVEVGAFDAFASFEGVVEGFDFGVRESRRMVPTLADDFSGAG